MIGVIMYEKINVLMHELLKLPGKQGDSRSRRVFVVRPGKLWSAFEAEGKDECAEGRLLN